METRAPTDIAFDNYSVHTSQKVEEACGELEAADVHRVYLAKYCPEQSGIEPVWNDVKQHHLPIRSFERAADLKRAVDDALAQKAQQLRQIYVQSTNLTPTTYLVPPLLSMQAPGAHDLRQMPVLLSPPPMSDATTSALPHTVPPSLACPTPAAARRTL